MSLKEKIETNYNNSLKSKDKAQISTYRLILSSIKDLDIANRSGPNKKETSDEDIKKLLKKMIKQRDESIDIYKKNNRQDLLVIGDNLNTDIKGANNMHYDSLFIKNGIHQDEFNNLTSDNFDEVFDKYQVKINYYQNHLSW